MRATCDSYVSLIRLSLCSHGSGRTSSYLSLLSRTDQVKDEPIYFFSCLASGQVGVGEFESETAVGPAREPAAAGAAAARSEHPPLGGGARDRAVPDCRVSALSLDLDHHFCCSRLVREDVDLTVGGLVELRGIVQLRRIVQLRHIINLRRRIRDQYGAVVMTPLATSSSEACEQFSCFGGTCTVLVTGSGPAGTARLAAERARRRLREWHEQFSRFESSSELSRLNQDRRENVPVSAMMARFVGAAVQAAEMTYGLVDPTLVTEVEQAGYAGDLGAGYVAPAEVSRLVASRRAAGPSPEARWRQVAVDRRAGIVTRPVGVRLDSGGIAKGLFGDVLAEVLSLHESFVIAAAGDVRLGGEGGAPRAVQVTSPFEDGEVLHALELARGAVATSGTTKRSWLDEHGQLSHHLLDPATGRPAFTGVVQATAIAGTGVEAEALAKAALLSGPEKATDWLPYGGVVAYDDGTYDVLDPTDREAIA